MPGPPAKPTALRIIEGDRSKGKIQVNKNEPKPAPIAPEMPKDLHKKAEAMWKHIGPRLEAMGLLTAVDGEAFHILSMHYAFAVEAAEACKKEGILVKGRRGNMKHPAMQIFRDNSNAFRQYLAEFGMTPASRSRLSVPGADDEDVWADIE